MENVNNRKEIKKYRIRAYSLSTEVNFAGKAYSDQLTAYSQQRTARV